MLSFQVREQAQSVLEVMHAASQFRFWLFEWTQHYDGLVMETEVMLKGLTGNVSATPAVLGRYRESLSAAIQELQKTSSMRVFERISGLVGANWGTLGNPNEYHSFLEALAEFAREYDSYLSKVEYAEKEISLLRLLSSAKALLYAWDATRLVLQSITKALLPGEVESSETTKALSIILESDMGLSRFVDKLAAIDIIYTELCLVTGVSYIECPPRIARIEGGSLWAEILGYPKIIDMIDALLEGSISYLYRTFTREGRIASIPRSVDSIESILELRKKLAAIGVETAELDDNLKKASIIIAEQANRLLVGEPRVRLNGRVFTIGKELETKYLEAGRQLFLPKSRQTDD